MEFESPQDHHHHHRHHHEHNILRLAPEGMDLFNQMFFYGMILSIAYYLAYSIAPRFIKAKLEKIDWSPEYKGLTGLSFSGILAFVFLVLALIFSIDTLNTKMKDPTERGIDREFRHRHMWMIQSSLYQTIIIAAIWLSINFQMKLARA